MSKNLFFKFFFDIIILYKGGNNMNYTKTTWENDITPVSAENMNKIEN